MVSTLWKACQDGDENRVDELLNDTTSVDIEIKDHTGITPLIQAVKGGHVNIVKALLAKGADPINASAQARPETYTTDPYILHLLAAARGEPVMSYPDPAQYYPYPQYSHYPGYPDPSAQWYQPPPPPPPPLSMQLQAHQGPQEGEHTANLPPPEVARNIPCRYYPECRFGSACVFAHPQTPYFAGALPPPAQYGPPQHLPPPPPPLPHQHPQQQPPYDPTAYPPYYPVPVPISVPITSPFAPQGHPHPPHHPTSPPGHMRTHSEILSSPPFSPGSAPVPILGPGPAGGAPGPGPGQHPLPVQYLPPPMSPEAYQMYAARRPSVTSMTSYPSPVAHDPSASALKEGGMMTGAGGVNGGLNVNGTGGGRSGDGPNGRQRRGSAAGFRDTRGPSYGGRKPPCLFFPSGRCRNGDGCRFPHVAPENSPPPPHQARGNNYSPRSRAGYYGGYSNLEERLSGMAEPTSIPPDSSRGYAPAHTNDPPSSSTSSSAHLPPLSGSASAPTSGGKNAKGQSHGKAKNHGNHSHTGPAHSQPQPQRVPSADDFPVLQANGHGHAHTRGPSPNSHSAPGAAAGSVTTSAESTDATPSEGFPKVKPAALSGASTTSASTPAATPGGITIPLHTPTTPGANGHAHMNGWANAMNGTGPTAAQLLRERERGEKEREREREKGTGGGVGSGRSSPRIGKEAKPQAGSSSTGHTGAGKSLSTKTSTTSLKATSGSASENLTSKSKQASEVQVSA